MDYKTLEPENQKATIKALGNTTNFSANRMALGLEEFVDSSTGEVLLLENKNGSYQKPFSPTEYRFQKYLLQSQAKKRLSGVRSPTGKPYRVGFCLRTIQKSFDKESKLAKNQVHILKNKESGKCHFGGLLVCTSVWLCPVCAAKITERRGKTIQGAIDQHLSGGGDLALLTFTFPHDRSQALEFLLKRFKAAENGFQKTRAVLDIKKKYGFFEPIKSLEITYGTANGWHPHSHQLWFFDKAVDIKALKKELFPHWVKYCIKRGLPAPSFEHGLDVIRGNNSGDYVAKMGWSVAKEVSKGHTKKGKKGRFAPFDLLQADIEGIDWAAEKFREYAAATFGSQYISRFPKLVERYGLDDSDDETICKQLEEPAELLGSLTPEQWRKVLKFDLRAEVLTVAESRGFFALLTLLDSLEKQVFPQLLSG